MKRYTVTALAKLHGIAHNNLKKSFDRHGIRPDKDGKYTEADYLKAKQMGAAMDKSKISKQVQELAGDGEGDAESEGRRAPGKASPSPATLTYFKLQRQVKKLDIEIQMAQCELDAMLGKSILMEKHNEIVKAVQGPMISWWNNAIENIATRRKDAKLLKELRNARDRASAEILG